MTTPEAQRLRGWISIVLSIATLIVLLVVFVLALIRNDELGDATQANRATLCAGARLISLNPVRLVPDESVQHYQKRLIAAGIFLRLAADIDCDAVLSAYGIRAEVTTTTRGGDAQSPQSGSQLPRAARDLRRRPRAPDLRRLTLDLSLNPRAPTLRAHLGPPARSRRVSEIGSAH